MMPCETFVIPQCGTLWTHVEPLDGPVHLHSKPSQLLALSHQSESPFAALTLQRQRCSHAAKSHAAKTNAMDVDLSDEGTSQLLAFTKEMAYRAGEMIRTAFAKPRVTDYERKSATDPVTETDKAVEAYIYGRICERFPGHKFIGEESASNREWTDEPTWIIDPIDGTANFIHRIPLCAVSIALTVGKEYIIGVIYNPMLDELFEATHLMKSKLNGEMIRVSQVSKLESACVGTECGSDRSKEKVEWVVENLTAVLRNSAQCVRMMGSCALNMGNLACGRLDVLYERGPYAWDMAAGVLIIQQAGGVVRGGGGGLGSDTKFRLEGRSVLAYTPTLTEELGMAFHEAAKQSFT